MPGPGAAPVTRVTTHAVGPLRITTVTGQASIVVPNSVIPTAPGDPGRLVVAVHGRGVATFVRHGAVTACGRLGRAVLGAAAPSAAPSAVHEPAVHESAVHEAEDFELHLVDVPLHLLGPGGADVERLCRLHPHIRGEVAPLLSPLLRDLAAGARDRPPRTAERLAAGVVGLLRTLAAEAERVDAPGTGPDERDRHDLAPRLRAHVNEHLWDRDLTPENIAAHHHISTRLLHRIFAAEGTTVARWIQRRRLEECRRELTPARPGRSRPAVASVARRWGFANPAHFSRSFRAAYGLSPTAWRDGQEAPGRQSAP
ncbi:helix-turn-helix domain-containing protein [Streptomyces sp. NPDC053048]|uniref:helix-turn-helix domain-containing protein n=1 Tax=Streptomyces sp. NPDC053048 TaxID=3365694 RepID=UPI0037D09B2E